MLCMWHDLESYSWLSERKKGKKVQEIHTLANCTRGKKFQVCIVSIKKKGGWIHDTYLGSIYWRNRHFPVTILSFCLRNKDWNSSWHFKLRCQIWNAKINTTLLQKMEKHIAKPQIPKWFLLYSQNFYRQGAWKGICGIEMK